MVGCTLLSLMEPAVPDRPDLTVTRRLRPASRGTRRVAATLLAAMLAAACSSDGAQPAVEPATPLTSEQAVLLAETLVRTGATGGATFVALSEDRTTGRTISLDGEIDWERLRGRAVLDGYSDTFGPVTEVAWSRDGIAELRPDQADLLADRSEAPDTFFLRAADAQQNGLDRLLTVIVALAADQAEDPELLLEPDRGGLLRTDTLRGTDVLVMRYSARSIYWVDAATGLLLRFEGIDASGVNPIVIDLVELGPRDVPMPSVSRLPLELRR